MTEGTASVNGLAASGLLNLRSELRAIGVHGRADYGPEILGGQGIVAFQEGHAIGDLLVGRPATECITYRMSQANQLGIASVRADVWCPHMDRRDECPVSAAQGSRSATGRQGQSCHRT